MYILFVSLDIEPSCIAFAPTFRICILLLNSGSKSDDNISIYVDKLDHVVLAS